GSVAQDQTAMDVPAPGLRAHIQQDEEHLVRGRDEPDVGLPAVEVEGLDGAGLQLAVVDLLDLEARQSRMHAALEPPQLGERAAVVVEALELHQLDAVDPGRRRVLLEGEGPLGLVAEVHPMSPTSLRSPSMKLKERGLEAVQ